MGDAYSETEMQGVAAILTYHSDGCKGAGPQAVGADGRGQYAVVFYGDVQEAEREAGEHLRAMERAGHKIRTYHFVVRGEKRWGASALRVRFTEPFEKDQKRCDEQEIKWCLNDADLGKDQRPAEPHYMNRCIECGNRMVPAEGCAHCPVCGYSVCG